MKKNNLKKLLKENKFSIGSWVTLSHASITEVMVDAGFDWLVVDMEHSVITLAQAQSLIKTIELKDAIPLVRVGENNSNLIKRVMDAGAYGIVVPMVNTKEDAETAVRAVKYPPYGSRGVGLARAQGYGFEFEQYKDWVHKESIVIAQIEHINAIENLDAILSVEGIDGTIIGPYDLSGSLGVPGEFENRRVTEAVSRYEEVSKHVGKPMGFHVVQPDIKKVIELKQKGYSFLAVGLDALYLGQKCKETLKGIGKE
jgi:2-dehydro-3-deoxyglucarate aldolase